VGNNLLISLQYTFMETDFFDKEQSIFHGIGHWTWFAVCFLLIIDQITKIYIIQVFNSLTNQLVSLTGKILSIVGDAIIFGAVIDLGTGISLALCFILAFAFNGDRISEQQRLKKFFTEKEDLVGHLQTELEKIFFGLEEEANEDPGGKMHESANGYKKLAGSEELAKIEPKELSLSISKAGCQEHGGKKSGKLKSLGFAAIDAMLSTDVSPIMSPGNEPGFSTTGTSV